ncbi:hypothetical protein EX30DRAFT_393387 [Ascodesmis nigricans]|uniref:Uncharacterized protein n=1 Tax=Ascodesmis nigricans TaxID=341454 RepID=A0A4S2N440_9PEZI|nr:hypothetical protein EX30DRAFT_393387 [Ascodesmis nigricans]
MSPDPKNVFRGPMQSAEPVAGPSSPPSHPLPSETTTEPTTFPSEATVEPAILPTAATTTLPVIPDPETMGTFFSQHDSHEHDNEHDSELEDYQYNEDYDSYYESGSQESTTPSVLLPALPSFSPTPTDVTRVFHLLTRHLRQPLPAELVLAIIDFADYYPMITATLQRKADVSAMEGRGDRCVARRAAVVSEPVPKGIRKIKKVEFWMRSGDQGWSGEDRRFQGTYRASYTWFEAAILRPKPSTNVCNLATRIQKHGATDVTDPKQPFFPEPGYNLVPPPHRDNSNDDVTHNVWNLQLNRCSTGDPKSHIVRWYEGSQPQEPEEGESAEEKKEDKWDYDVSGAGRGVGFVEALMPGDRVVVLARAIYPGWVNRVEGVEVRITMVPI